MKKMNQNHRDGSFHNELRGEVRVAVEQICQHDFPEQVMARAVCRVKAIDASAGTAASRHKEARVSSGTTPESITSPRVRMYRFAAVGFAACLTLLTGVAVWVVVSPSPTLADVVAAIGRQEWIHVTATEADGTAREVWISPRREITALRDESWIEFHDHRLRVYYSYHRAEKQLYRVPEMRRGENQSYRMMFDAIRLLLQDDNAADSPLDRLTFLSERSEMKLKSQERRQIETDGRKWLEHQLVVQFRDLPDPIEMVFRVDPSTRLPTLCRMNGIWQAQRLIRETKFEYPEPGPVDVYDLGIPRTAKLIDRVPTDDIARIVDGVQAGRERFENYRAIVVRRSDREYAWWAEEPYVIYRKGDRYRVDFPLTARVLAETPADDQGMAEWWKQRVKQITYFPMSISHRHVAYKYEYAFYRDADRTQRAKVESVRRTEHGGVDDEVFPPYWSYTPEFICRPPMGIPRQDHEALLETSPSEGLEGTLFLEVRRAGVLRQAKDPNPPQLPPQPNAHRYWIDADQGYLVLRNDSLKGPAGEEEIMQSVIVEKVMQSPQGYYYPAAVRQTNSVRSEDGEVFDQLYHFYLDFDVELPDSLFETAAPGTVY